MTATADDLRYPIGRFEETNPSTAAIRTAAIDAIATLPHQMRDAVAGLSETQLDTPYRPGGWTVRQLVHHVADSHLNAYVRLKLALTENTPTITPYDERRWAELPDSRLPIDVSLTLLDTLHTRMVVLWRSVPPHDFARGYHHPEYPGAPRTLEWMVQMYGWHSRHHVAHITALRRRQGW